ncbi:hypothetical protein [Aureimonas sp. ME7]|uniref:hypothetical protein n=1 Tax=Aureimonas sp. ME7 TaxID=2744252 RepID=UPI0015F5917A|nr:hypothetical protein [Aureimonas sp. ME7]
MTPAEADLRAALARIGRWASGYSEGVFEGRRYGVTLSASEDGRRRWIFGEELGGTDRISANLYELSPARTVLRPCEMPAEKVVRFLLEFAPSP